MPTLKTPNNPSDLKLFKRDKAYYDALVVDFCGEKSLNESAKGEAALDRKIIDLLIQKWNVKAYEPSPKVENYICGVENPNAVPYKFSFNKDGSCIISGPGKVNPDVETADGSIRTDKECWRILAINQMPPGNSRCKIVSSEASK